MRLQQYTAYLDGTLTSSTYDYYTTHNSNAAPVADKNLPPIGAPRAEIQTFTPQSQRRLRRCAHSIDWEQYLEPSKGSQSGRGFFLTLDMPTGADYAKGDLAKVRKALGRSLSRHYGTNWQGAVWKAELGETGLLHLHLMMFLSVRQQTADVTATITTIWRDRIHKEADPESLHRSVNAQAMYHGKHRPGAGDLIHYLSKQPVATKGLIWQYGKCWGCLGENLLPVADPVALVHSSADSEQRTNLLIQCLKDHPVASQLRKVQQLNLNWVGFTVELDPQTQAEVLVAYQYCCVMNGLDPAPPDPRQDARIDRPDW